MSLIFAWCLFSAAPILAILSAMGIWRVATVIGIRECVASWALALPTFAYVVGRLWVEAFRFLMH